MSSMEFRITIGFTLFYALLTFFRENATKSDVQRGSNMHRNALSPAWNFPVRLELLRRVHLEIAFRKPSVVGYLFCARRVVLRYIGHCSFQRHDIVVRHDCEDGSR